METIKLSTMTGKLGPSEFSPVGMMAINTNPLTNPFCGKMSTTGDDSVICGDCYSIAMLKGSRKNCVPRFQANTLLLQQRIPKDYLPFLNLAYVRGHGHGELKNLWHYLNFSRLATKNPQTTVTLFTKRRSIVNQAFKLKGYKKPNNLILVYSNPIKDKVISEPPKHFDKVFNVTTSEHTADNCTGRKCIDCLNCYKHDGPKVLIEKVKKRS